LNASEETVTTLWGKALAVRLGQSLHAIPIAAIEEVLPELPIEPIPCCPPFVRGVISVRGHLIPVVDAAERLGLDAGSTVAESHIVCVNAGGRLVGIQVDEAIDLIDLTHAAPTAAADVGAASGFFAGVVQLEDQVFRVLDPDRLLSFGETRQLERIAQTKESLAKEIRG